MTEQAAVSRFTFSIDKSGATPLVRCKGRLAAGVSDLLNSEVKQLISGSPRVVLDFNDVSHIDSSGIGMLIRLYVSAKSGGCALQVSNLGKPVRRLLGVTRLLEVFDTVAKARTESPRPIFGKTGSLDGIFNPRTVALVGASQQAPPLCQQTFSAFLDSEFRCTTYVVQPGKSSVAGQAAYSSMRAVPSEVDLAVVVAFRNQPPRHLPNALSKMLRE